LAPLFNHSNTISPVTKCVTPSRHGKSTFILELIYKKNLKIDIKEKP
jgi:hypothetical protein